MGWGSEARGAVQPRTIHVYVVPWVQRSRPVPAWPRPGASNGNKSSPRSASPAGKSGRRLSSLCGCPVFVELNRKSPRGRRRPTSSLYNPVLHNLMWGPETNSREPRMPVGHHNYPRYVRTHVSQTREVRSDPLLTGELPRGGNCRGTVCEHVFQRRSEGAQQTTRTGGATTRPPPKGSPPILGLELWIS